MNVRSIKTIVLTTLLGLTSLAAADEVISAGQPDEARIEAYADEGVMTIIDLRTAAEDRGIDEQTVVEAAGMKYLSLPVGRTDITFEKAAELDALLESVEGPVVVHCGSGNRVGALMALRASSNGASDEEALEEGERFRLTGLKKTVEALLDESD